MSERAHGALVIAAAPVPGTVKRALEPRLGPEGCARLQAVLVRRALAWAAAVAPGAAYVAVAGMPEERLPELVGAEGVEPFAQSGTDLVSRLAAAVAHVGERHAGPLLCASTDLPSLGAQHARMALDDLAAGCDVSFGPSNDGGCYLLGLAAPRIVPGLEEALGGARRHEIIARALAVSRTGARLGLLRSERELHGPDDADALLADPAAPAEVVATLG